MPISGFFSNLPTLVGRGSVHPVGSLTNVWWRLPQVSYYVCALSSRVGLAYLPSFFLPSPNTLEVRGSRSSVKSSSVPSKDHDSITPTTPRCSLTIMMDGAVAPRRQTSCGDKKKTWIP